MAPLPSGRALRGPQARPIPHGVDAATKLKAAGDLTYGHQNPTLKLSSAAERRAFPPVWSFAVQDLKMGSIINESDARVA